MAKVKYQLGITINLGNYENAKIDCGIELDCDQDQESMEEAFEDAKEFVKSRVKKEEMEWRM